MNVQLVLTDFLDRAVSLYGEKEAVHCEGRVFTYQELNNRVNQLSHGLRELGVEKGEHIAYLAGNSVEMLEGFYGIYQLGGVMVPLNTRLRPEDYLFILNHSESKILFVDQYFYNLIKPIINELETIEHIIIHYKDEGIEEIDYDIWLESFPTTPFDRALVCEEDVCSLLYTSGTTGNPKGVMLTHRNNYLHALSAMHHLRVTDKDVYLHVLPMFHVNGWGAPFYYTANGATHICSRKTTSESIYNSLENDKVSIIHMAPTVLNSILQYHDAHQPVIEQDVRVVVAGAAPPAAFITRVEEELGWAFIQVYGMTESSPLSLISRTLPGLDHLSAEEKTKLKAKAGYPLVGTEVRVIDDYGNEVVDDGKAVGEVVVKGHGVMKGYWKNEQATMEALQNGWLYTGDMGTVDSYGYIDIVDRKKDVIISGGENISSIEVEGVLYEHPAIFEVAVVAIPHEKWGETPHAFIVLRDNQQVTEDEIIEFCRGKLAHFKAITGITFIDELPRNASGKVLKVQIRKQYSTIDKADV